MKNKKVFIGVLIIVLIIGSAMIFLHEHNKGAGYKVKDIQIMVQENENTSEAQKVSGEVYKYIVNEGSKITITADTEKVNSVKIVIYYNDNAKKIFQQDDIKISNDKLSFKLDDIANIPEGVYMVNIYLNGGDLVNGSTTFKITNIDKQ